MIPPLIDRVLYRLARLHVYRTIKDQPRLVEDVWRRLDSEDAEFTTSPPRRAVKRKKRGPNGARPRKIAI